MRHLPGSSRPLCFWSLHQSWSSRCFSRSGDQVFPDIVHPNLLLPPFFLFYHCFLSPSFFMFFLSNFFSSTHTPDSPQSAHLRHYTSLRSSSFLRFQHSEPYSNTGSTKA